MKGDLHAAGPERRLLGPRADRRASSSSSSRRPRRPASTRSGPPRPTAPTPPPCSPGWPAQTERSRSARRSSRCPARSPAMTAMTAATLDHLSDGRMLLGIGSSGPAGGRGLARPALRPPAAAHARVRGDPAQGARPRAARVTRARRTRCRSPTGPGKALKLMIGPVQERIPIYIAAIGPKNTQLAGEIADGWLPIFFSPEHVGESRALLEEGAARSGRYARRLRHRAQRAAWRSTTTWTAPATSMRPVRGAVRGRHGLAREELLQRARAPLRLRGGRRRGPGPLPRRQEGRGRRGDPGRADRPGDARAARASGCGSGSRSTATRAWAR